MRAAFPWRALVTLAAIAGMALATVGGAVADNPPDPTGVGDTTLSNIQLNGVTTTVATVAPGSNVTISADWSDSHPGYCPGCIDFVATGWAGQNAAGCIEDPGFTGESGSGSVNLGPAPTTPGVYDIVAKFDFVYHCGDNWSASASSSYPVIARVIVAPPDPTGVGDTTLSNIRINGVATTVGTVDPGGNVTISADWSDSHPGYCPGCIDFVATGWAGQNAAGCIEDPGFTGESGSGSVNLGSAPTTPGVYAIVAKFDFVYHCGDNWSASGSTGYPVIGLVVVRDADLTLTNVPASITVDATSSAGAIVTYTPPTVVDEESPAVSCDPASGSMFPIGTTTVTCSAIQAGDANSPATASFQVTVLDDDLTLTNVPASITVDATSPAGATATYTPPTAVDEDAVTVSCDPASGSTFPIGTTTVSCTAVSDDLNAPVGTFTVTVRGAADQLGDLLAAVTGVGPGTSLADKVTQIQGYVAANDTTDACGTLAAFVREVKAQTGKKISAAKAATLIAAASQIENVLGC